MTTHFSHGLHDKVNLLKNAKIKSDTIKRDSWPTKSSAYQPFTSKFNYTGRSTNPDRSMF